MENDLIKKKCRKVYIQLTANKIFDYGGGEYEFISAFKDEKRAQDALDAKLSTNYEYDKHRLKLPQKVVGFYLVPIKLVDKPGDV